MLKALGPTLWGLGFSLLGWGLRRREGESGAFLKPRSQVRSLLGAPIYDVCKNFSLGGFGGTRARRGHHGEGRARACFDDDFVFTDDDVVDQILKVDPCSSPVTSKERFA